TDELAPTDRDAGSGGWHARLAQDLGHARCGDAHADSGELADDAAIAPSRILTREPQYQLPDLARNRGSARPASGVRPPFPHKCAMPTKQRVRANEERRPTRPPYAPPRPPHQPPAALLLHPP